VVSAALMGSASEGAAAFTTDLLTTASDPDDGETATLQVSGVSYAVDDHAASATAPAGVSLTGHTLLVNPADSAFNHLSAGETTSIVVYYNVTDAHGATVAQTETVTITGTNDASTIVGETDPSVQTVILAKSATVLPSSNRGNDLGLPTETFDHVSSGNGDGEGNAQAQASFYSSALHATFTASGAAYIAHGSSSSAAAPFMGPEAGHADSSDYLAIGANGRETITFDSAQNTFGLYWGSVDSYNTISFYKGGQLIASYTGSNLGSLVTNGGQASFASNGYVEFKDLAPFDKVVLASSQNAFELDNVSAGYVADSHVKLASPIEGTLVVNDADVGDTLTASVVDKAIVIYNGSSKLPANLNVDALASANAVSFDSVTSDGKSDVLHWSYHPTGANLDFLEPGDTLSITFKAQVSDGHATLGAQPLTVTIAGNGSTVVNGTAENDSFDDVGGGVTVMGNGGHDTFVFNTSFGSATIGDFNVNDDTIEIDHSLFATVKDFVDAARPTNSGLDTVITDAAHDTMTLKGVTVAQLSSHSSDFHII